MKTLLQLLREGRTARRDAVAGRMRGAQVQLALAREAHREAIDAIGVALAARRLPWSGSGPAANPDWRQAMQASCDALVECRHSEAMAAQTAASRCAEAVEIERVALVVCERALMRHDEWAAYEARQNRLAERLDEQNQDDDFAAQIRRPGSLADGSADAPA